MTKISDERLAEMLVGLESATPGPWEVVGSSITDWGREWDASMSMEFVPNGHDEGMNSRSDEDSAHIARCDPDTIRSLITELQHLRAHNSDSAEPVADMIQRWQEEESNFYNDAVAGIVEEFETWRRSALASPPAKEVEVENPWAEGDGQVIYEDDTGRIWHPHRGYWAYKTATALAIKDRQCAEMISVLEQAERFLEYFVGETNGEFVGPGTPKACLAMIRALTNRTPDDEVGNG